MATPNVSFAPRRSSIGRTMAGLVALGYPLLMVVLALGVGARQPGDLQDFAASFVAAVMLIIALPTTWFLSFDFIEVSRTTVVVFGLVTSLPLWYLVGTFLAVRSETWAHWVRNYITAAIAWTLLNLLILAVIGALAA
jgi:hypothetical protein